MQVGLGPLGQRMVRYLHQRGVFRIVGAVDVDPAEQGRDLGEICGLPPMGVAVSRPPAVVLGRRRADVSVLTIVSGMACGVQQIGRAFSGARERITLVFRAAIGEPDPEDTVEITGTPNICSTVKGGMHGDVATCAITLNAIPRLLEAGPGLHTMTDISLVSYFA